MMSKSILRKASFFLLAIGAVSTGGSAQNSVAPDNIQFVLDINFVERTGQWESSGAFTDEGIIADVARHDANGRGSLTVLETLSGSSGTFTWKFTRNFSFTPSGIRTAGAWQMISGTGSYSGITGQGKFEGVLNPRTGEIRDTFTGHVRLGYDSALTFREVE